METDDPKTNDEPEEPWDGPPQEEPEQDAQEVPEEEKKFDMAPGPNELRVVQKIEDYISTSRGPRIQVIKSRDLKNAEHFSTKVLRVLQMRGYEIEELTVESLSSEPENDPSTQNRIYSINESVIKEYLGPDISQVEQPMRHLFDTSMLSYLRRPVVISTVSDGFYNRIGMQSFTSSSENSQVISKPVRRKREAKSNNLTVYSFYIAAIAFALSAVYNLFGGYLGFQYAGNQFTPVPGAILFLSLAAISLRAFSLGRENRGSIAMAAAAILIFIVMLLIPFLNNYLNYSILNIFSDIQGYLFSTSFIYVVLSFIVMLVSLSKYALFLGSNSGKASYLLVSTGIALVIAVVFMSNLPFVTVFGQTLTQGTSPTILTPIYTAGNVFVPTMPIFGNIGYFSVNGTEQYYLLRNFILLLANVLFAVSFVSAARNQKTIQPDLNLL